jgi:cytochrome c2
MRRALLVLLLAAACDVPNAEARREAAALTGGDPRYGPMLMRKYGCQTCHTIPGVDGADGLVGPPLGGIAARSYIGGVLTNTPENMMKWIMNPKGVDSLTAMPNTGVTDSDARHIAAYLYTLR